MMCLHALLLVHSQGTLSPKLLVLVHQIFDLLDEQGIDAVDPSTLIAHYDADRHPQVLSRQKSADQVMQEFLDTFDVGGASPGMVTRDEFVRYYTNLSASYSDDGEEYFETILRGVWHMNHTNGSSHGGGHGSSDGSKGLSGNQSSAANRLRQAQTIDARARANSPAIIRRPSSANGMWHLSAVGRQGCISCCS